jgi:hypothetical protein
MNTNICVVGGGSGGFGAACAAARLGARVILIEAGNGLGGTSTWAGVNNYEPVAGATGLPQELCERLQKLPETITIQKRSESYSPERPWGLYDRSDETDYRLSLSRRTGMPIVFEPEAMANLMLDLHTEAGCDVRLNTRFTQLHIQGDRITSITTQNDQGEETIHADIFIDATGNIHLASAAGCQTAIGTETPDVYGEPSAPEKPEMVLNNTSLCYRITPLKPGEQPDIQPIPNRLPRSTPQPRIARPLWHPLSLPPQPHHDGARPSRRHSCCTLRQRRSQLQRQHPSRSPSKRWCSPRPQNRIPRCNDRHSTP